MFPHSAAVEEGNFLSIIVHDSAKFQRADDVDDAGITTGMRSLFASTRDGQEKG
jgi:hypothetical protein